MIFKRILATRAPLQVIHFTQPFNSEVNNEQFLLAV